MAKPSVDGLEHEIAGRARVARVDADSPSGQTIAARYGVRGLPTYVLISPQGDVMWRQMGGRPDRAAIEERLGGAR